MNKLAKTLSLAAYAAFSLSGCYKNESDFADKGCPYIASKLYARLDAAQTKPFMGRINNALSHMAEDEIHTKLVNVYLRDNGEYFLFTDDCSIIPIEKKLVMYGFQ